MLYDETWTDNVPYVNVMKIIDIIEARMTSIRLPGKVMMPFVGKPSLELMVERLTRSRTINQILVATTRNKADDVIVDLCKKLNVSFYRGSEEDVLKRVVEAGKSVIAEVVVRTTADCPLVDWRIVDRLVKLYQSGDYDYVSNVIERSFPLGFDIEVFSFKKLQEIGKTAMEQVYREHPPYYFYTHPKKFLLKNWKARGKMHWPDLRVTLDTQEDYIVLTKIFGKLYPFNPNFSAEDVVELLHQHPEWVAINSHVEHRHLPRPTVS